MIDIRRWNYQKHEYEPYEPREGMKIVLYSSDMNEKINCTSCGVDMTYGDGYTSRELHNSVGLGYPVCEYCYEKERETEELAKGGTV